VALAPAVALAHGDDGAASGPKPRRSRIAHAGGSQLPAETPPAPAGDGATAQGIVRDLEAQGAKDAELAKVVAEPVKTAKRALERAHGARAAGDEQHARMLDALALGWAEAGKSLIRAAEAERVATAVAKKALEVQTRVERARALLEETQARRERAAAELVKVEADAKEAKARAADAESQRMDVAKQRGNKGAAPPAAKAKAPKGAK
jgi:hypothetical protein